MEGGDGEIGVGLMGLGVVGSSVAQHLLTPGARSVPALALRRILVRDPHKPRPFTPPEGTLTTSPDQLLQDPAIQVVVEVMGGEHPAVEHIRDALSSGRHVVTANKEVMAKHGADLAALAAAHGVELRFEASVGGGVPIIGPLQRDLLANEISSVRAIINGTTNYILTRMARDGVDFPTALTQAQELGYAEPDPTADVEGTDAAYKLAILAWLAFRTRIQASDIYCQGITHLQAKDFQYARELGYALKLLAIGRKEQGSIQLRVHPVMIPLETPLAKVEGAFNAIEVHGDLVGPVVVLGQGAGAQPTTSALIGDLMAVTRKIWANRGGKALGQKHPNAAPVQTPADRDLAVKPMADLTTQYYLRLNVSDHPGVLAQIATVLGEHQISLASVIQKDADADARTAEIVITTHPAREAEVQAATQRFHELEVVTEFSNLIRMEPT